MRSAHPEALVDDCVAMQVAEYFNELGCVVADLLNRYRHHNTQKPGQTPPGNELRKDLEHAQANTLQLCTYYTVSKAANSKHVNNAHLI